MHCCTGSLGRANASAAWTASRWMQQVGLSLVSVTDHCGRGACRGASWADDRGVARRGGAWRRESQACTGMVPMLQVKGNEEHRRVLGVIARFVLLIILSRLVLWLSDLHPCTSAAGPRNQRRRTYMQAHAAEDDDELGGTRLSMYAARGRCQYAACSGWRWTACGAYRAYGRLPAESRRAAALQKPALERGAMRTPRAVFFALQESTAAAQRRERCAHR